MTIVGILLLFVGSAMLIAPNTHADATVGAVFLTIGALALLFGREHA